MAYYQQYTYTNTNQYLLDLEAFTTTNGWTIDLSGVYNTSYRRLHLHKGSAHFDLYSDANYVYMYHCTGFASGSSPSTQPGVGSLNGALIGVYDASFYWFVSTVGGLYMAYLSSTSLFRWGCFFIVQDKIGAYADGFGGIVPSPNYYLFSEGVNPTNYSNQIYINGAWGIDGGAGAMAGSITAYSIPTYGPNHYNLGIIPWPVLITINYAADTSKRMPVGFAPGLYQTNGGDVYNIGDEIIIGADTYLILPSTNQSVIGTTTYGDFLFKLGA
jgi:hypothetical protein